MTRIAKLEPQSNARELLKKINAEVSELVTRRNDIALQALKELCQEVFGKNPELKNFAFGISGREYNDEGLYEGINHVGINIEVDGEEHNSYFEGFSWGTQAGTEKEIADGLNELGEEAIRAATGEYDIVVVDRQQIYLVDAGY